MDLNHSFILASTHSTNMSLKVTSSNLELTYPSNKNWQVILNYLGLKSNTQQEGAQNRVFGENDPVLDEAGIFSVVYLLLSKLF